MERTSDRCCCAVCVRGWNIIMFSYKCSLLISKCRFWLELWLVNLTQDVKRRRSVLNHRYFECKWVLPEQAVNLVYNVTEFIISICGRQFELQNEPIHLVDADGDGHTLLNGVFDQPLCVEHHLSTNPQKFGLHGSLTNITISAEEQRTSN